MTKILRKKVFYIAALLFVLSSVLVFAMHLDVQRKFAVTSDFIGVLIGGVVLTFIITISRSFKGSLRKSFNYMAYGIAIQILALVYTIIFLRLKLYAPPLDIDVHHHLMLVGIIFFGIAAYNLRKMMSELNKKS